MTIPGISAHVMKPGGRGCLAGVSVGARAVEKWAVLTLQKSRSPHPATARAGEGGRAAVGGLPAVAMPATRSRDWPEVASLPVAGDGTADELALDVRGPEMQARPDARVGDLADGCETLEKLRVRPALLVSLQPISSLPQNCWSVLTIEPLSPVCADGWSG